MELTAKTLHDVEFRERFRGYDPEEVDAFLEEVARGVESLHERLREVQERFERTESRSREAIESEETLRRTLVIAQKTADATVADAKERAGKMMAEAEEHVTAVRNDAEGRARRIDEEAAARAKRTLEDTNARAARMIADAQARARAGAEELRTRLREEITGLSAAREQLLADINRLEAYLAAQRARVVAAHSSLAKVIDDPNLLRQGAPPEPAVIEIPVAAEAAAVSTTLPPPSPQGAAAPAGGEAQAESDSTPTHGIPQSEAADATGVIDLTAENRVNNGSPAAADEELPPPAQRGRDDVDHVDEQLVTSTVDATKEGGDPWQGRWRR